MVKYPGISDPNAFHAWIEKFKKASAWECPAKADKAEAVKKPIGNTLHKVRQIPVLRGTVAMLELNLLYACYMASKASAPELDEYAEERLEIVNEIRDRPKAIAAVAALLGYTEAHRMTALKAIAQAEAPPNKIVLHPTTLSAQRLETLEKLLADIKQGLMAFQSDKGHEALFNSADFCYGPFEFHFDVSKWKSKGTKLDDQGRNIIRTGLMFHLTYLFRFFTSDEEQRSSTSWSGDILMLNGVHMLSVGTRYGNLVAALTNAVFGKQYSSRNVRDNLDALHEPTPGSKAKKKAKPLFIGW